MATDDERRRVAERLREKKAECEERGYPWMCDDLILALGYDHDYEAGDEIFDRLADLIEPSDRNDELCVHCDYCDYCDLPKCSDQDGYSFKPKGYVDLLVLADKTIRTARHDMEICGDTVPAWYAAGRLEAVARNIREILGVES